MKTFYCDACSHLVFFENVACLHCGATLGFLPDVLDLSAVAPAGDGTVRALSFAAAGRTYRTCANARQPAGCNWLVPSDDSVEFCTACRLNAVIPDLSRPANRARWHRLELAKRRLLYTLLKLQLPTEPAFDPYRPPLRFRFLAEADDASHSTGHADGVITIDIAEADDDIREQRRLSLHEPFRTLLGHFRHEVAHYYWSRLIDYTPWLGAFRQRFGDESFDYGSALHRHYRDGPPANWADRHVTAYASSHPWEDWAETTAHYFHINDTIETAASFGLSLRPRHPDAAAMSADLHHAAHPHAAFDEIMAAWFPLTSALNALNRGMGLPDLYPFVLSETVIEKLRFVHEVFAARPARWSSA